MNIHENDLEAFVAESDRLGGPGAPGCEAYWASFTYQPTFEVDQALDPFSDAYVDQQLVLYAEISGRAFDQNQNEQAAFDVAPYAAAVNPYNHPDPSVLALHLRRLTKAIHLAGVSRGDRLLDMGCGWGLSSEIAAYSGLQVTAVDINPGFVELVNTRADRLGWDIQAQLGTFDDFQPTAPVDMVLFYECLHHALRPWTVVERLAGSLAMPAGRIVLAGEPINATWWEHWGLRLDALSVYCIRKFGWFESGWSLDFIRAVFHRCGLSLQVAEDADTSVGYTLVGRLNQIETMTGDAFLARNESSGFVTEGLYGVLSDRGWIEVVFPEESTRAQIVLLNVRATPLKLRLTSGTTVLMDGEIPNGQTRIALPRTSPSLRLEFEAETWVPDSELANGDLRDLSLHLAEVCFS